MLRLNVKLKGIFSSYGVDVKCDVFRYWDIFWRAMLQFDHLDLLLQELHEEDGGWGTTMWLAYCSLHNIKEGMYKFDP